MKSKESINEIKATVIYILKSFPEGIDWVKLFKLMYFAQQKHLVLYGRGIVNEKFHAHERGPVPGYTFEAIYSIDSSKKELFAEFLEGINVVKVGKGCRTITTNLEPDMDEFSGSDIEVIDEIIELYKDKSPEELSDLSHKDSAWIKAFGIKKEDPQRDFMSDIDIAKAGDASDELIEYIKELNLVKNALGCN